MSCNLEAYQFSSVPEVEAVQTQTEHGAVQESVERLETPVGRIIQMNYVLNDAAALKKKLRNETNRKEPYTAGSDAKDGSNVVILMKTSFFEHVKSAFMKDMMNTDNIVEIGNATASKAPSGNSGDAFVEYALEIKFKAGGNSHGVKLTAYATSCKLQIQQLGEKPGFHTHLGNRSVPRCFTDMFFLPWCENAALN